jgi:hypothetical protein
MKIRKEPIVVLAFCSLAFASAYFEWGPVKTLMDQKAVRNTRAAGHVDHAGYQVIDHSNGEQPLLTVDFLKGKHFWNPQVAIWLEDSTGHYLETLLVTTSTAKGLFYAGRSALNFKEEDEVKTERSDPTRRVDALPYWSHKRGHQYRDGFYSPPPGDPLPDGITSATPTGNFLFKTEPESISQLKAFRIMIEINVAFDENEYYSEYDFPEDSVYHSGTGLLGQPSIIYEARVSKKDQDHYYIMSLLGHGHHSGATGEIFNELNTVTTARYIVERLVVGVNESWYSQ